MAHTYYWRSDNVPPTEIFRSSEDFENFASELPRTSMNPRSSPQKIMKTLSISNSISQPPVRLGFTLIPLVLACFTLSSTAQAATPEAVKRDHERRAVESYGKLPLSFEANQGQTDPQVKFLSRGNGYSLFLTATEAVLVLKKTARDNNAHPRLLPSQAINDQHKTSQSSSPATVLHMKLVGSNATAKIAGTGELPGKSNYLIGNNSNQWRTNLSNYTKVEYRDVYPGVDLVYYGNQRQLEHDFVVAPGADPKAIRLAFQGARKISVNSAGDLVLDTKEGEFQLKHLRVYQKVNGAEKKIAARYVLKGKRRVAFEVAEYDRHQPLVIDPVLSYSTFLGGNSYDGAYSIAVDASGNAYVTGWTSSTDFATTSGAFQTTFGGGDFNGDAFVTKLNPTGSTLVYSTYLGGSSNEYGHYIAVDASGNAYVTGVTSSTDFATTSGAFQTTYGGGLSNGFVTKLNPTGSALVYSTYLGGNGGNDTGYGIALDASGNAYVAGLTESTNFPTTPGAFQTINGGQRDAFVTKLNPGGSALVYSTYLGGSSDEEYGGLCIAVDASGNAYVTGDTYSFDFPTTSGAFQTTHDGGGGADAYVTKLNPTGSALVYSSYLGGNSIDVSEGIAVDTSGNAYVTGGTTSTNFPTTSGAFQTTNGGSYDAFVTKLDSTGSALIYSTYLGGNSIDFGTGIAVDASGNAYVTGATTSTNFPTTSGAFQTTNGGSYDAYLTKLNSTGNALIYSTYLGGNSQDAGDGIALDASGNAYVAGYVIGSANFPTTAGAFQVAYGGGYSDAFVAKFTSSYSAQIQQPINPDGTSVFNVRRGVVPVKFTLTQDGTPTCALPAATIAVTRTAGGTIGAIDELVYTGSADNGSNFRIDSCQYVYNLSASALGVGTYRVDIIINGNVVGSAAFQLK